jgi:cytochrome P450
MSAMKDAAGPPGLPLVGHLPAFLADKLGFLMSCADRYGDVVKLRIGEPTYLLTNADDIRHVLIGNPSGYNKTPRLTSARGKRLSGSGLQTSFGEDHLRQRRLLQPLFHRRIAETFFDVMLRRIQCRTAHWSDGAGLDIAREMEMLALSIIIDSLFGDGFRDADQLAAAITIRRRYIEYIYGSLFPFPEYLPSRTLLRYRRAQRTIDETIDREIHAPGSVNSFTTMLRDVTYPGGFRMTEKQVRDEILALMSTGYETIGDALSWTLYLLGQHPVIESAVLDELRQVLQGRLPEVADIPRLRYTRMVFDESMRLYPPTWIFVRIAMENDRLPSGVAIMRGAKLYLCQYVMHRRPNYFPEPDRFDPQRFTEEARESRHRFAYFPFGGGPHTCIGEQFALLEGISILAVLLPRFQFQLEPGQTVAPRPTITLRPKNGIRVRIRSRLRNLD